MFNDIALLCSRPKDTLAVASMRESKFRGIIARHKERYNSVHVEKRFSSRDSLFGGEFEGIIGRE